MLGRAVHELPRDAAPLIERINGDDVDDTHSLVERVECDGGEPHRAAVSDRNEDVPVIARTTRAYGLRLNRLPVRLVEAREDCLAEDMPKRLEHRLPRPQRERDDRFQIRLFVSANLDASAHSVQPT